MKKALIGSLAVAASIILYGFAHVSTVIQIQNLRGWDTRYGKYLTALLESGSIVPLIISVAILCLGVYFLYDDIKEIFEP